jgi:hypothetical protein
MKRVKHCLAKLTREVFHRGETFAIEGGISFGPGRDPKGSFYNSPKVAFYWYQPDSANVMDEQSKPDSLLKSLVLKIGSFGF